VFQPAEEKATGAKAMLAAGLLADGRPPTEIRREYLQQNHWQAMRRGLDGRIIEPATGEVLPMREQIDRMLEFVAPKSRELQSAGQFAFAREMLRAGTEAQWQVERWEAFGRDLVRLELEIADRTTAEPR